LEVKTHKDSDVLSLFNDQYIFTALATNGSIVEMGFKMNNYFTPNYRGQPFELFSVTHIITIIVMILINVFIILYFGKKGIAIMCILYIPFLIKDIKTLNNQVQKKGKRM
jgi:hypothetical protein